MEKMCCGCPETYICTAECSTLELRNHPFLTLILSHIFFPSLTQASLEQICSLGGLELSVFQSHPPK